MKNNMKATEHKDFCQPEPEPVCDFCGGNHVESNCHNITLRPAHASEPRKGSPASYAASPRGADTKLLDLLIDLLRRAGDEMEQKGMTENSLLAEIDAALPQRK